MYTDDETKEVTLYFSPVLSEIASMFGAQSCDKPNVDTLKLIVGDQKSREYNFQ